MLEQISAIYNRQIVILAGVIAILPGALGILLAAWVVLANYRATEAFELALWVLERLPSSLDDPPPVQLANEMMQRNSLILAGVAAFVLCRLGFYKLMPKLITNVLNLLSGILVATMGIALAAWVVLANYRVTEAFDWALWALELLPFPLNVPLEQLADEMTQRNSLIATGVVAALLCWIGFGNLRGAQKQEVEILVDADRRGSARLELREDHPRVGRVLEGTLRITDNSLPGNRFRVGLSCTRIHWRRDETKRKDTAFTETAFVEQQEVQVVRVGPTCSVPFRFNVPASAPPSSNTSNPSGFLWHLSLNPLDSLLAPSSTFTLRLDPAPAEEVRAIEATETPQQKAAIDAIGKSFGQEPLLPHERAILQALPPAELAARRKGGGMSDKIIKWILIVFFGVPIVISGLVFAAAALLVHWRGT